MRGWNTLSAVVVFAGASWASHAVGVDWGTSRWVGAFLTLAWMGRGADRP